MTREELWNLLGTDINIKSAADSEHFREHLLRLGLDPNSYYQEVEMSSPYVNTHRDITYRHEVMNLHSHVFYEIVCCRTSCGAEYLVGSRRYSLQKGDIILIRPGVSHCVILPNPLSIPYERDIIWLSDAFQAIFIKLLGLSPNSYEKDLTTYLIRTANTPWEYLCDMIHHGVLEEVQKRHGWQANVIGSTLQLMSELQRAYLSHSGQSEKAETPDLLDEIIAYIEEHFPQKLSLTDVARHFYISERTISTLFRKRLGVSFHQFLTQRRLISAKTLILDGCSLETISDQVGFGDYSAFFRAFKSEFGISPRDFRKIEEQKSTVRL